MKAIQFRSGKSLADADVAALVELPVPVPGGHDILVKIEAVALNPVDTKVRPKEGQADAVLGFDAAGTVAAVGDAVTGFKVGDAVFYAGDLRRSGSNAEFQLVDERIVGLRPASLEAAAAAALPLTSLTAWESLFDRMGLDPEGGDAGKSLLIIGGAGGVGSVAIQLAKQAGLTVIATASRDESAAWCRQLGADAVVDHHQPLRPQLEALGHGAVDCIANFHATDPYWQAMGDLIAPEGRVVLIVEPTVPLALGGDFKRKSVTIAWETMFTRSMFSTPAIGRQRRILDEIARRVDAGALQTTLGRNGGKITVENIVAAHRAIETRSTIGKIVLAGW